MEKYKNESLISLIVKSFIILLISGGSFGMIFFSFLSNKKLAIILVLILSWFLQFTFWIISVLKLYIAKESFAKKNIAKYIVTALLMVFTLGTVFYYSFQFLNYAYAHYPSPFVISIYLLFLLSLVCVFILIRKNSKRGGRS